MRSRIIFLSEPFLESNRKAEHLTLPASFSSPESSQDKRWRHRQRQRAWHALGEPCNVNLRDQGAGSASSRRDATSVSQSITPIGCHPTRLASEPGKTAPSRDSGNSPLRGGRRVTADQAMRAGTSESALRPSVSPISSG